MQEGADTRRSLGDRIIRIGAIAAAVVTIVGLARLVWPDPAPRLFGEIADVSIVTKMTLAEFADRQKLGDTGRQLRGGDAVSVSLAYSLVAQESPSPSPSPDETVDPSPSPTPTETPADEIVECPACTGEVAFQFEQVQNSLPSGSLPPNCRYTSDGEMRCSDRESMELIMPPEDISTRNGSVVASSESLLEILDGTRSRETSAGESEPIGVAIGFDLALEGFRGRKVDVRWSLFTAKKSAMVPQDWLVNRKALEAVPEADFDRRSGEFWIPLPRRRGPYFVRVSAWHRDSRLDFVDSGPFD